MTDSGADKRLGGYGGGGWQQASPIPCVCEKHLRKVACTRRTRGRGKIESAALKMSGGSDAAGTLGDTCAASVLPACRVSVHETPIVARRDEKQFRRAERMEQHFPG